jgi:hypothetical protein
VQAHKGIIKALLVSGDLVTFCTSEIDQLGVLANLRALINLSTDISTADSRYFETFDDLVWRTILCNTFSPVSTTLSSSSHNRAFDRRAHKIITGMTRQVTILTMFLPRWAVEHVGSTCQDICLVPSSETRVLVRPLGQAVLIVSMRRSANPKKYGEYINDATAMLEKGG